VLGLAAVLSVASAIVQFFVLLATLQSVQDAATSATGSGGDTLSAVTSEALLGSSLSANLANLVSVLVSVVVQIVATGLFTVLVGAAVLGVGMDAAQAWARTRPVFWRLVGLTLLSTLATVGLAVAGIAVGVVIGVVGGPLGIAVGILIGLAALAATVWVYVNLVLSPAALVLERATVIGAWRRSFALTRGSFWRIFGIFLVTQVIASLVASVLVVPLALVGTLASVASGDPEALPWPLLVTTALGQLVSGIVTLPFVAGVTALLYVDRRIRREALDLRLMAAARETAGAAAVPTAADPLDAYREPAAARPPAPPAPPPW
jgi:hypothetical protein